MTQLKPTEERVIPEVGTDDEKYCGHLIFYDFMSKYVNSKIVLDDGCGTGYGAFFLTSSNPTKIIGLDRSLEAVSYANKNYRKPELSYIVGDGTKLPFENQTFDVITSSQVIEHVPEYKAYLNEAFRVLKEPGLLLLGTPNKQTFNPNGPPMPFHYKEFLVNDITSVLHDYFEDVSVLGQYNVKRSQKKNARFRLIRIGQSKVLSSISPNYRVRVGRRLAKFFGLNERYSLEDFVIRQPFHPSISMNIICVCSKKRKMKGV